LALEESTASFAALMVLRDLVLDDLRGIDDDHLGALGLVLRAPELLRGRRTPSNVIPFAGSPVDDTTFGFLMEDPAVETLEAIAQLAACPICILRHRDSFIVPNLRSFLSLVALAGADAIGEVDTDEAWLRKHSDWTSEPVFRTASEALCRLPGVSLPAKPCSLVTRPDRPLPRAAPRAAGVAGAVALWQAGKRLAAETEIRRQVATMLSVPDLVRADRWSELQAALVIIGVNLDEQAWTRLREHGVLRPK
jgi:hypothetical protein